MKCSCVKRKQGCGGGVVDSACVHCEDWGCKCDVSPPAFNSSSVKVGKLSSELLILASVCQRTSDQQVSATCVCACARVHAHELTYTHEKAYTHTDAYKKQW